MPELQEDPTRLRRWALKGLAMGTLFIVVVVTFEYMVSVGIEHAPRLWIWLVELWKHPMTFGETVWLLLTLAFLRILYLDRKKETERKRRKILEQR